MKPECEAPVPDLTAAPEPLDVLIVEDSEEDALLSVEMLRAGGFSPCSRRVENGAQMRKALAERVPQVILADHKLPSFSAMEAFTIYRESGLDIPFLIVSGSIGTEIAVSAMRAGVHDYLFKDKLSRLAPAVRRELQAAATRQERARVAGELNAAYSELSAIYADCPVALLVVDGNLRIERANGLAAALAGRETEAMRGLRLGEAFPSPHTTGDSPNCTQVEECLECTVRLAVSETTQSRGGRTDADSSVHLLPQGDRPARWLLVSCSAVASEIGLSFLVCAKEVTELKQAHLDLEHQRDALALQAHLINLSHDAVIISDAEGRIREWNRGAEEIYGWSSREAVGAKTHTLLRTQSTSSLAEIGQALLDHDCWEGELAHIHKSGQTILSESRQVLLQHGGGRLLEINRDITQRRRDEDALKAALAEKTVLLQEIHHRVKNNLAVIASLLSMKAGVTDNPSTQAALAESRDRIHSMALIHEHLYGSGHLDRVDFSEYARGLAHELLQAFTGEPDRIAVRMSLEPIELGIERAVPCALILNELLANALKYAYPNGRHGHIAISFRESSPGTLELIVEDDGPGMPPGLLSNPTNKSLGLRIVNILARQLDGSLQQEPCAGTRIVIRFPRTQRKAREAASQCGA